MAASPSFRFCSPWILRATLLPAALCAAAGLAACMWDGGSTESKTAARTKSEQPGTLSDPADSQDEPVANLADVIAGQGNAALAGMRGQWRAEIAQRSAGAGNSVLLARPVGSPLQPRTELAAAAKKAAQAN